MKQYIALALLLLGLLCGCGYSDADLNEKYQEGYRDGEAETESKIQEAVETAYKSGYTDGMTEAYGNVDYQATYEDEIWGDGYSQGLYDGYQERKKDEQAGAPDQYEDYDNWFYFWTGIYPDEVDYSNLS